MNFEINLLHVQDYIINRLQIILENQKFFLYFLATDINCIQYPDNISSISKAVGMHGRQL